MKRAAVVVGCVLAGVAAGAIWTWLQSDRYRAEARVLVRPASTRIVPAVEALVSRAAEAAIGGAKVTFRGHELDLAPPWQRVRFVDALESANAWSRDPDELCAKLGAAGVDTSQDKTWTQLVDHAYSHFVEPQLVNQASLGLVPDTWSSNQLAYQMAFRYADVNAAAAISVDLLGIGLLAAVLVITRTGLFRADD